jgi:hypothetical protein
VLLCSGFDFLLDGRTKVEVILTKIKGKVIPIQAKGSRKYVFQDFQTVGI